MPTWVRIPVGPPTNIFIMLLGKITKYVIAIVQWSRTPAFHAGNAGSNPASDTKLKNMKNYSHAVNRTTRTKLCGTNECRPGVGGSAYRW